MQRLITFLTNKIVTIQHPYRINRTRCNMFRQILYYRIKNGARMCNLLEHPVINDFLQNHWMLLGRSKPSYLLVNLKNYTALGA